MGISCICINWNGTLSNIPLWLPTRSSSWDCFFSFSFMCPCPLREDFQRRESVLISEWQESALGIHLYFVPINKSEWECQNALPSCACRLTYSSVSALCYHCAWSMVRAGEGHAGEACALTLLWSGFSHPCPLNTIIKQGALRSKFLNKAVLLAGLHLQDYIRSV